MRKKLLMIMILGVLLMLSGCKVIDTVKDDLEISGYEVVESSSVYSSEYTYYDIYHYEQIVGYIYEFSTFRQARDYYNEHLETFEDDEPYTWVIHNQLIVGAYDQQVIYIITNA